MSLFERINNKRYDLQEVNKKMGGGSNSSSNDNTKTRNSRRNIKKELQFDPVKKKIDAKAEEELINKELEGKKKEKFTKYEKDRAKSLKTTPGKLERDVQKGLTSTGGRTSRFPFAKKSYKTSGKAILQARQKYNLDPTGNVDMKTTKARLVDRIVRNDPKFNVGSATKFVDELEKSQGPLSKKTGKDSSLYKTVKAEIDARNPTVKSKKSGGRLPLRSKKTGEVVKKNLDKFYKKVGDKVDPKFKTPKNLDRTELNLQFKADKLKQDYGGKLNPRDGLKDVERKRQLKKLQRDINIKNPTITSPKTGGQLPATKVNLKKYGFIPPTTTPLVTPDPITEPLKKTRTLKKIKIKAPPKTGTFKKIMKFAGKNRNPILKGLAYTAGGAYLLSRLGKTDNAPKNNKSLVGGPGNYITKVKPVTATFTLAGKGGDGYRPAGMKK